MQRYYFDYAATTPLLKEVQEEISRVMAIFGNPSSIHHHGRLAKNEVEEARKKIANLLNASLGEIFFTSGATESNNTVLLRSITDLGVKRIISSPTEHHCILHTLEHFKKVYDIEIQFLDVDKSGNISLDQLAELLSKSDDKTLVSLMHGNNEIGTMHPIKEIGKMCRDAGALFHTDAAQTYGKVPIDLQEVHIDFLSAAAHKIYAPKGIGLMYIKDDHQIEPLFFGGAQERNMRSGTENILGMVGFATASEIAQQEMQERHDHILKLRNRILDELHVENSSISINGNQNELFLPNIISLNLPKNPKTDLLVFNLDIAGISASAGSACSSGVEQASHVLSSIDPTNEANSLRISLSQLTTDDEVDYLIKTLKTLY